MTSATWNYPRTGIWRFRRHDSILVGLAALQALVLVTWPLAPVIAVALWWNANTIAHNFIHRPFFRTPAINRLFSAVLSLLQGIPQTLWKDCHLAHHAGVAWHLRLSRPLLIETALVLCLWLALACLQPHFFFLSYLPGYLVGLAACAVQGHQEHALGRPVSHYGRLYNFLCFNDGYHAEHHDDPSIHWTRLPRLISPDAAISPWPPLLRWLSIPPLEALELLVLRSPRLQRYVLARHSRAFRRLLPSLGSIRNIVIVGGGLFPRTALILQQLLPRAHLVIVDSSPRNLRTAQTMLRGDVEYRDHRFIPGQTFDCDLTIIPLCLEGDREEIYRRPPSPAVLVHDWMWHPRGTGAIISTALFKRLNLVRRLP